MMSLLVNAIAGFLFGLGLVIGGMANPAKVLNFLDLTGSWDPSLAFVMAGAVAVTFIGYKFVFRQPRPLLAARFHLPEMKQIDRRLILGAAIFGVGWDSPAFAQDLRSPRSRYLLRAHSSSFRPCSAA